MESMDERYNEVRAILGIPQNSYLLAFHCMSSMDMIFWNCRGAGNNTFKRNLKELLRTHKPEILILMETKVELNSMGMFFNRLGFMASAHVDLVGRSGGKTTPDWLLSVVYASPNARKMEELWQNLKTTAQQNNDPWLVAGCVGPRLTWTNNRQGWTNSMVRLDRALYNTEWRTLFPDGCVRNLPRTYSDHSLLMISNGEFRDIVIENWKYPYPSLDANLKVMADTAMVWNRDVFGGALMVPKIQIQLDHSR
ncbi:hypothetical protein ACSBR1_007132 [Camellia fascicularis]